MNLSTQTWPALSVKEVQERFLVGDANSRLDTQHLPIVDVTLPVPEPNQLAVVSWRWDTAPGRLSRNIASVVRHAKHAEIAYLFIDAVSIHQGLPTDQLMEEVVRFSKLYEKLPVIAAYNNDRQRDVWRTIGRPWIHSEMRLYQDRSITYVGHDPDQGCRRLDRESSYFNHCLYRFNTGVGGGVRRSQMFCFGGQT